MHLRRNQFTHNPRSLDTIPQAMCVCVRGRIVRKAEAGRIASSDLSVPVNLSRFEKRNRRSVAPATLELPHGLVRQLYDEITHIHWHQLRYGRSSCEFVQCSRLPKSTTSNL